MTTVQIPKFNPALEAQLNEDFRKLRFSYFVEQSILHVYTKRPLTAFVTLAYANNGKYQMDFAADKEGERGAMDTIVSHTKCVNDRPYDTWAWITHFRKEVESALNSYGIVTAKSGNLVTAQTIDILCDQMRIESITPAHLDRIFSGSREMPSVTADGALPALFTKEKWCPYDLIALGRCFGYHDPMVVLDKIHRSGAGWADKMPVTVTSPQ
jgi:hypothetical protein